MNPNKVKMVADNDNHYVMHDGRSEFKVPKAGLSKDLHAKILKMADGGSVPDISSEPLSNFSLPSTGFDPQNNILSKNQPREPLTAEEKAAVFPTINKSQPVSNFTLPDAGFDPASNVATDRADKQAALNASTLGEKPGEAKKKPQPRVEPGATKEAAPATSGRKGLGAGHPETAPESDAQKALKEKARIKELEVEETANLQQKAIDHMGMLDNENQRNAIHAHQQGQALIAKHTAAVDDMAKINTTVDPDRYWASRSTEDFVYSGRCSWWN